MNNEYPLIKILAIDDDIVDQKILERSLKKSNLRYELDIANNVELAAVYMDSKAYDCLLIDYMLPGTNGIEFLENLNRQTPDYQYALIMLTGEGTETVAVGAMKAGAHDYLVKNDLDRKKLEVTIFNAVNTIRMKRELHKANERLAELAFHDSLTGLVNRHVFEDRLKQQIELSRRENRKFFIAIMDLNGFKGINDSYGHQAGDHILQIISERMASCVREADTLARYGGDEFALLMNINPLSSHGIAHSAKVIASKIQNVVCQPIKYEDEYHTVGISIGFSLFGLHGTVSESLLKYADKAMYESKNNSLDYYIDLSMVQNEDEEDIKINEISLT